MTGILQGEPMEVQQQLVITEPQQAATEVATEGVIDATMTMTTKVVIDMTTQPLSPPAGIREEEIVDLDSPPPIIPKKKKPKIGVTNDANRRPMMQTLDERYLISKNVRR
ncbi:unnamed protein product [Calypogeia fissa]